MCVASAPRCVERPRAARVDAVEAVERRGDADVEGFINRGDRG